MTKAVSRPDVTLSIIGASNPTRNAEQKVLLVGQMLAAGTATGGDLYSDIGNDGQEDTLFAENSHLAGLVREFKKLNKYVQVDALPLDDASGTAGTAVFTITGTATETGTVDFIVGSEVNHKYTISIVSGDLASDIGDDLVTAITADTKAPFSAANVSGVVTVTCEHDGTLCNNWDVKVSGEVAGVSVALTAWSGGATDPTLTGILDVIDGIRYQTIVWPSAYAITELQTEMDARFNVANQVLDGIGVQSAVNTQANLESAVSAWNSQSIVYLGDKAVDADAHKGAATAEMPDVKSTQFAAERSLRLSEDAPLTQILTTVARNDQFGGMALASLPYFNTDMPNLPIAGPTEYFTQTEQGSLEDAGVSSIGPNKAFNGTIMNAMVTTYLTDTAGNEDESYKYLNTVDTISAIREYFFNNLKSRYAQTRLTDGDLRAGRDMANESSIRAFCNKLYDDLADETLVQAGSVAKKDFDDNLSVSADIATGTVTINMAPLLVTQLRAVIGTIQVNFGQ